MTHVNTLLHQLLKQIQKHPFDYAVKHHKGISGFTTSMAGLNFVP